MEQSRMTARLVMDPNPVTLQPGESIAQAGEKFLRQRYRSLAVVDEGGRFLGTVTVNTMLKLVLPKAATMARGVDGLSYMSEGLADLRRRFDKHCHEPVEKWMTVDAVRVAPDTSLLETLRILYYEKVNLPVVDPVSGRLEGMISYFDVGERILAGEC